MYTVYNYVNGRKVAATSARTAPIFNPALGEQVGQVGLSSAAEVQHAIQSARAAWQPWSTTSTVKRARVFFKFNQLLEQHNDEIVAMISREHGKVWSDAQGELTRGKEVVEFVCGIPHLLKGGYSLNVGSNIDCYDMVQSLGVVAGITPFNFPAMVPMWMFPVAIAAGNSFILKPSERDPSTPLFLAELLSEAGLPDGVFNVVNGDKEAVDAILASPTVQAVSFVGSTPIAQYVYETGSKTGKRVQALGGAKNHMVVMADADLDMVESALVGAAYGSAGERCMAISVVLAHHDIADELVKRMEKTVTNLSVGPGYTADTNPDYGPVITKEHREKIANYVEIGKQEGATVVVDGRKLKINDGIHNNGFFIGGTLFDNVTADMRIYKEEIFGPTLCIVRIGSLNAALELVNNHEFGNGTAIFTRDGNTARTFAEFCNIGMVGINVPIPVPMAFHSFGGWKRSIFSSADIHGPDGIRFYTHTKKITARWPTGVIDGNPFVLPTM